MTRKYSKIGLIAGDGNLPLELIKFCKENDIAIFVAILNPKFSLENNNVEHKYFAIGSVGKIFKEFRKRKIKDIVFAGRIKKPQLKRVGVDFKGFLLLMRLLKAKIYGDDKALSIIAKFVEDNGFNLIGIDEVVKDLLVEKGFLGKVLASSNIKDDIEYGVKIANEIGKLDIGQAIIVQQGVILGVEAIEGTDELIKRCGKLKYDNAKKPPILIKLKKPNQERRIDLPTIGINTLENMEKNGIKGLVLEAGSTLILDREQVLNFANQNNIFILGI